MLLDVGIRNNSNGDLGVCTLNLHSPLSGFESIQSSDPKTARFFRITFPERGKIILRIGPGDHTVQQWELTPDDIKGLVRDCIPELLR